MTIESDYNFNIIKTKHDKISKKILLTWGTYECLEYMNNLLKNNTHEKPFSFDVTTSIFSLIYQHEQNFPYIKL